MSLELYNTRTREKEVFVPIENKKVGMYSCGPTVYWYQHIGNLRTYIFSDSLKRVLGYNGYKVKHVINITDVGHLTSDSDTGADKMEESAKREGKNAEDIANYYFSVFDEDLKKLNIIQPDIWCKATDHIKEQIKLIEILEKKGYTYRTSDGIYFDTSKFPEYGKFANLNIEGLKAGKRIDLGGKKNKTDFALWKFSNPESNRQQEWESPWGVGFPGWHIECSAMSSKYLGEQFDIHTGGIDHVPIHHTNEIAQSECAFGKQPSVKFWMHGEFLTFKDGKMSKSSGKILTISDLEKQGFDPLVYRYFCLTTHYRKQLIFSKENLISAKNSYERLKNILSEIKNDKKINKEYLEEFEKAIDNDLDMPNALQVLWKFVRDENVEGKIETIKKMDEVFGLDLLKFEEVEIPSEIKKLVDEREKARKKKDFETADKLRDEIKSKGYSLEDKNGKVEVKKI